MQSAETDILLDYCAERLDAERTALVCAHLEGCPDCREIVAAQSGVWAALEAWDEIPISVDFNRRLYARIEEEEAHQNPATRWVRGIHARWSPFTWGPALSVAAACAVLAIALVAHTPHAPAAAPTVIPQAKIEKVEVDQVERTLDDLDMLKQLSAPGSSSTI